MAVVKQQVTVTIQDGAITDISLGPTTPLTPQQGPNVVIASGGTPVLAIPSSVNGGYIANPSLPDDQGLSAPEPLFYDQVGGCDDPAAGGTIMALWPGERVDILPGSTLGVYVNAATAGHRFTAVFW